MPGYPNYPGVDEDLNFPPAVRTALTQSPEFYNAITAQLGDALLQTVSMVAPGAVQDEASRDFPIQTSNTSFSSNAAADVITGLELTVFGTGRMVELDLFIPQAYCTTTAGRSVAVYLLTAVGTSTDYIASTFRRRASGASPLTDRGDSLTAKWDITTVAEETYKFKVGVSTVGVGTSRLEPIYSGATYPITFKARNH